MQAASSHDSAVRDGHGFGRFHERVLGERAGAPPHDAVAALEAADAGPDRNDLAGAFAADRLPGPGLAVQAMSRHELAAVEACGVHPHEQLRRARLGRGASRSSSMLSASVICIQ